MPEPYADTLATVASGRTAMVERLRTIASRLEELPLDAAAKVWPYTPIGTLVTIED